MSTGEKEKQKEINAQHDELVITQILDTSASPGPVHKSVVLSHPHFGGKQPKQHQPPKCISVICKDEKETLKMELADALKELANTKEELSECLVLKYSSLVVNCIVCAKLSLTVGATVYTYENKRSLACERRCISGLLSSPTEFDPCVHRLQDYWEEASWYFALIMFVALPLILHLDTNNNTWRELNLAVIIFLRTRGMRR